MNNTKVSVIIPAYNAANTIEKAIRSVQSQSLEDWELIIVDDGSTDHTPEIVGLLAESDKRIQYVRQSNAGAAAARNHGIDIVETEYLAFLDADDTYDASYLERMVNALDTSSADFSICGVRKIGANFAATNYPPPLRS